MVSFGRQPLIFLIEHEAQLRRHLERQLSQAGYAVKAFAGLPSAIRRAEKNAPSLVIVDAALPGHDAIELCTRIRGNIKLAIAAIVLLMDRTAEATALAGLDAGADDFVRKPVNTAELISRLGAVLRRCPPSQDRPFHVGEFELRYDILTVRLRDKDLSMTAKEFRLLEFFLRNPKRVFSREVLLRTIWGEERQVSPRVVDVFIRRLRKKIERHPADPQYLTTYYGLGYRFIASAGQGTEPEINEDQRIRMQPQGR